MQKQFKLLDKEIIHDSQHLFQSSVCDGNIYYGRIKGISVTNEGVTITLFHSQFATEKTFHIETFDFNEGIKLKRGDIIALDGISESSNEIRKIILLNSCALFPEVENWEAKKAATHREADVILNNQVMQNMQKRNMIVFGIREFLQKRNFCEVELPVLKKFPDIAPADHFEIANAKGFSNLFVRTTFPPFERLMVGFEKAYTIGPNFRNGDFSYKNLPEFYMFCTTVIGKHYLWTAKLIQTMFGELAQKINGSTKVSYNGNEYDISKWDEVELSSAFQKHLNYNINELDSDENLTSLCEREKIEIPDNARKFKGHMFRAILFDLIFEQKIVVHYKNPTFFYEVPWYLAGPAEPIKNNPFLKHRGEGYIGGMELMNAKCVLTSIEKTEHWHRTITDEKKRLDFGKYAERDSAFMNSVNFGFFPGSLASFGLDRLIMLLLGNTNISDVTMYPLIKD